MRLINANDVVKEILKERDKIPLTLPPNSYEFGEQPNHFGEAFRGGLRKALRCVEEAPTINAVPVVHGWWIENRNNGMCSVCKAQYEGADYNYCPRCGAKMDGDE